MVGCIVVVPSYPPEWSCLVDVSLSPSVTNKINSY